MAQEDLGKKLKPQSMTKTEEALFELEKVKIENSKMKVSLKDLFRMLNEVLLKTNPENPILEKSTYLPYLTNNNNHHFDFNAYVGAIGEVGAYLRVNFFELTYYRNTKADAWREALRRILKMPKSLVRKKRIVY
jgi:hypothetical protein